MKPPIDSEAFFFPAPAVLPLKGGVQASAAPATAYQGWRFIWLDAGSRSYLVISDPV